MSASVRSRRLSSCPFRDERKAILKVVLVAGDQPNAAAAPMRQDPEAVADIIV
jgi:hypothetical protein